MLQNKIISKKFANYYKLNFRHFATIQKIGDQLNKYYKVLGLTPECSKEELKGKYLELAKKYHPDTSTEKTEEDGEKFRQIVEAYRFIVDNDYGARDKEDLENVPKVYDIRHTAPQHRQYLEYGGVGHGTPSQRQRQYQQHRVQQASENVNDYMVRKIMAKEDYSLITKTGVEAEYARKWKTRSAIDRLVEDLIQESMKKGEFDNLAGKGKPLQYDAHNPYVDSMTHKLNQILIQNGFSPEWVLLEKEIKEEKKTIKNLLIDKFSKLKGGNSAEWSLEERKLWNEFLADLNKSCLLLNKKIDHFNLVCPAMSRQMVRFQLQREGDKLTSLDQQPKNNVENNNKNNNKQENSSEKITKDDSENVKPNGGVFKMLFSAFSTLK